jgi:hypothetical protein
MSLAAPNGSWRNVLRAEVVAAIGENLCALVRPVGVLAVILWACEVIRTYAWASQPMFAYRVRLRKWSRL